MNLLKLQDILGESIEKITNENLDELRKVEEVRNAQNISIVAKQMISNANIIFRSEKAISEEPVEEIEEEIVEGPDETTKMIDELTEEPAEEEEGIPTIIGTTPAERLHSCLFIVELCDQKIAIGEKAKKDKAAILPMMDKIYKEFRGGDIDGSND